MKDSNIIDLASRVRNPVTLSRIKDLEMRIDAEQTKLLISTSLISILFLVSLANNSMLEPVDVVEVSSVELPSISSDGRGPASAPTGTSAWEDNVASRLSNMSLKEVAAVGRAPSLLEKLAFGFLEGKYTLRLESGKIRELAFTDSAHPGQQPKSLSDRVRFLTENRELLPVDFDRPQRIESHQSGDATVESYNLLNRSSIPVAKVRFHLDSEGRLLSMKVELSRLAAR